MYFVSELVFLALLLVSQDELHIEEEKHDTDDTEEGGKLLRIHWDTEKLVAILRDVIDGNTHKASRKEADDTREHKFDSESACSLYRLNIIVDEVDFATVDTSHRHSR